MKGKSITIFAGAGASKGVNSELYPTTVEFFENLPVEIKSDPLFNLIVSFIKSQEGSSQVDIEQVLWRLEELGGYCKSTTDTSELPAWAFQSDRLIRAVDLKNHNVGHLHNLANTAQVKIKKLRDLINTQVYKLYSKLPNVMDLENTWLPLLRPIVKSQAKVELITTNYDVIIESALDVLAKDVNLGVDTGWRGTIHRTLDSDLWTKSSKTGLLTKLHGSVNWTRDGGQIYIGDPTFKGSHENHAIIYPGFKGKPSEAIFQSFHTHFRNVLQTSDAVVFIGFAFRDEHINDLCDRTIRTDARIVTIDPSNDISLPFDHTESNTMYVRSGFNKESVTEVLEYILE